MKKCNICDVEKPFEDFIKRSNRASGRQPYCKECHNKRGKDSYLPELVRDYDLKRNYGISLSEYDDMFKNQNGCCAICNKHIEDIKMKKKKNLCVDHCHKTNKIRGLLCDKCNRGIGLLGDSSDILLSAYKYVLENEQ